jgi:hypothetical protein
MAAPEFGKSGAATWSLGRLVSRPAIANSFACGRPGIDVCIKLAVVYVTNPTVSLYDKISAQRCRNDRTDGDAIMCVRLDPASPMRGKASGGNIVFIIFLKVTSMPTQPRLALGDLPDEVDKILIVRAISILAFRTTRLVHMEAFRRESLTH